MLSSINVKGFRKYENLHLENLGKINFILGRNNIGKTSILEAIYAFCCGQNVVPLLDIPVSRCRYSSIQQPYWMMDEILSVVHNRKTLPFKFEFSGIFDGKEEKFVHTIYPSDILTDFDSSYKRISGEIVPRANALSGRDNPTVYGNQLGLMSPQPTVVARWVISHNDNDITENITSPYSTVSKVLPFKTAKFIDLLSHIAVNETVQIYSSLKRDDLIKDVVKELNKVFPDIKDIDMIPYSGGTIAPISVLKDDTYLPMYAYGDGVQRWFYILGAIALYKNSIICIDEIDSGFHPEAQYEFSEHLASYAMENNVQLFLTTHNLEFIDNYLFAVSKYDSSILDETRIITVKDIDTNPSLRTLSGTEAYKARSDFNLEIR